MLLWRLPAVTPNGVLRSSLARGVDYALILLSFDESHSAALRRVPVIRADGRHVVKLKRWRGVHFVCKSMVGAELYRVVSELDGPPGRSVSCVSSGLSAHPQ